MCYYVYTENRQKEVVPVPFLYPVMKMAEVVEMNEEKYVKEDKEVDVMNATVEYDEKVFLAELEASLREMQEKKRLKNNKHKQSSWRDLFDMDEE